MKTIFASLAFLFSIFAAQADTVTGLVQVVGMKWSSGTKVVFTPTNTLRNIGGTAVRSQPAEVVVKTNGSFSTSLIGPMGYKVAVGDTATYPTDVMNIFVPGDSGTYDWLSLTTNSSMLSSNNAKFIGAIKTNGTTVGSQLWLNFVGSVLATNDPTNGKIDVAISGGGAGEVTTSQLNAASNAVLSIAAQMDTTTSNGLYSLIVGGGITAGTATNIAQFFATNSSLITSNTLWAYASGLSNVLVTATNDAFSYARSTTNGLAAYIAGVSNNVSTTSNVLWLAPYAISFPTGLVLFTHPRSGFFTDSSGTAAATNQALIARWNDASGRGNHLTSTNSLARPRLIYEEGEPVAFFANGETSTASNVFELPPALLINSRAFSFFALAQPMENYANQGLLQASNLNPSLVIEANGSVRGTLSRYGSGLVQSGIRVPSALSVFGVVGDSGEARLYLNGEQTNVTIYGAATASGGLIGSFNSGRPFYGKIKAIMLFDRALNTTEAQQVRQYLATIGKATAPAQNRLIFDGDSIVRGNTTSNGFSFPQQVAKRLAPEWEVFNFGVAGQNLSTARANATNNIHPIYVAGKRNVVVVEGGSNDIKLSGATGDTTYTNMVLICEGYRAAGFRVVTTTILPRQNDSAFNTERTNFNARVRAGWTNFADALADFGGDSTIGDAGDEVATTYYTDQIHPNEAGASIVATYVKDAIERIFTAYQPANSVLTNLAGTGAITNLQSAGNTNSTQLALVHNGTNTTGRIKTVSVSGAMTITDSGTNIDFSTSGSAGEANVNGEISITNATRIGLVAGKSGVTNLLRSIEPGFGLSITNQGTNVVPAVDASVIASQSNLTGASNTLRTAFVANDMTTSNGVIAEIITASNSLRSTLVANDTTTSNGAVAFTMTASNTVYNFAAGKQTGSMLLSNLLAMGISNIVAGTNMLVQTNSGTLVLNTVDPDPRLLTNQIWIGAGAFAPYGGTTLEGGRNGGTIGSITNAGGFVLDSWDLDDTTNEAVSVSTTLGPSFAGFATLHLHWTQGGATNNSVVWEVAMSPFATNNALSNYVWRTNLTMRSYETNLLQVATMPLLTLTNYSPRTLWNLRVSRLGTNTSDTSSGDARFLGAEVSVVATNWMGGF